MLASRLLTTHLLPVLLIAAALGGCTSVEDHLTIHPDGSGTVVIKTTRHNDIAQDILMQRGMLMEQIPELIYPPMDAEEAAALFPGDGFTIEEASLEAEDATTSTVTVAFGNVNDLLASPYGKIHALAVQTDAETGRLTVRCRSGLQAVGAMLTAMKPDQTQEAVSNMGLELTELESIEAGFGSRFLLTLPNPVSADEAAQVEGPTATWSHARSDHETREAFSESLQRVMTVSCAMDGIRFKPVTPVRLDLDDFEDLQAENLADHGSKDAVDPEKVLVAAEIKPLAVMLKRTSNYTGQGWGGENYGKVVSYVSLPKALQPLRWGEFQTTELIDNEGGNLIPEDEERGYGYGMDLNENFGWFGQEKPADPDRIDHLFSIHFKTPPITTHTIATLSGSIKAMYGGRPVLIKLPNVIKTIRDEGQGFSFNDRDESMIDHPALQQSNLTLRFQAAMSSGPGVMLMLDVESEESLIKDAQVFDAQGRPYPTFNQPGYTSYNDQDLRLMVLGSPQPPLSLALLVDAATTSIEIPVHFTELPLNRAEQEERK